MSSIDTLSHVLINSYIIRTAKPKAAAKAAATPVSNRPAALAGPVYGAGVGLLVGEGIVPLLAPVLKPELTAA